MATIFTLPPAEDLKAELVAVTAELGQATQLVDKAREHLIEILELRDDVEADETALASADGEIYAATAGRWSQAKAAHLAELNDMLEALVVALSKARKEGS